MRTLFAIAGFLWTCTLIGAGHEITPAEVGQPGYFTAIIGGASNGITFLTVWGTRHDGLLDLYSVVTDAKGGRLTARQQPIITGLVSAYGVAHVGNHYVVGVAKGSDDIRLMFLDADGSLIRITDRIATGWINSIAATDDRILVTYTMPPVYYGAPAAVLLDAEGRSTGGFIPLQAPGIAARRGEGFVVASSDFRGNYLQRFDANGRKDGDTIIISQSCCLSSVASNGDHTLVITSTYGGPAAATLIAEDGRVVGYRVLFDQPALSSRVVWYGDHYVIAVAESGGSGSSGTVATFSFVPPSDLGAQTVLADGPASIDALVATESALFAAVSRSTDVVVKTWTPPAGHVRSTIVSDMPTRQIEPVMVSDGVDFLTVWREISGTRSRLRASSTRSGSVIDLDEDDLHTQNVIGIHAAAYGNGQYLIVWTKGPRLLARRLDRDGVPIDADPIFVRDGSDIGAPAVAWNGSYFFVVLSTPSGLKSSFIAADGAAYSGSTIASDWSWSAASLAWNGSRFLLAYDHKYAGTVQMHLPVPSQVVLLQLNANGQIVGERAVIEDEAWAPRLATSGSEFLVSYSTRNGVRAAIAHPGSSLRVERPFTLLEWRFPLPSTAVAWSGSEYVVAYTYDVPTPDTPSWFAGIARVDREGTVLARAYQPTGSIDGWFSYVGLYPADPRVAIAAATSGDTRVALPEFRQSGSARITMYSAAELLVAPLPPAPPQAVRATQFSSSNSVLTWTDASSDEQGFLLSYFRGEEPPDFSPFAANAESGTTELTLFYRHSLLSAWNPGGFSYATPVDVMPSGRRRPGR